MKNQAVLSVNVGKVLHTQMKKMQQMAGNSQLISLKLWIFS